jgi:hypothetical protein
MSSAASKGDQSVSNPVCWNAPPSSGAASSEGISQEVVFVQATQKLPTIKLQLGIGRMLAFFLVTGGLVWCLDLLIDAGFRRIRTSAFGATNAMLSGAINADIVISGSSRALVHYDPRIIQRVTGRSAYNIGRNGSQTDMQLAVLKAYLQHNSKPKLVVHNLDLFSFESTREIYDPAQYIPYLEEEAIYSGVTRIYPTAWKWRYLPLYGYAVEDMRFTWIQGLKSFFGHQPKEDHFLGFVPRHLQWTGDFAHFRRDNPQGVTFKMETQGVSDLSEIIMLCRLGNIPLLLVYSPEYYEMQLLERNRDEIFSKFHEMAGRFSIPLWDYSTSHISAQQIHFYNSQHLNASGAKSFTEDLSRRLAQEPGLIK